MSVITTFIITNPSALSDESKCSSKLSSSSSAIATTLSTIPIVVFAILTYA